MSQDMTVSGPNTLAPAWSGEEADIIRQTLCPGASDAQLRLFAHVAKSKGLSPFANQISMQLRKAKNPDGSWTSKATFVTHIDGYRVKAARTGEYAGNDEPEFELGENGLPMTARCRVWRVIKGERCPFTATVRWSEFCPDAPGDRMWRKMPFQMLGKVAEAQALRKAFPEELGDLYIKEEMEQADDDGPRLVSSHAPTPPPADAPKAIAEARTTRTVADQFANAVNAFKTEFKWSEAQVLAFIGKSSRADIIANDLKTLAEKYDQLDQARGQDSEVVDGEVPDDAPGH